MTLNTKGRFFTVSLSRCCHRFWAVNFESIRHRHKTALQTVILSLEEEPATSPQLPGAEVAVGKPGQQGQPLALHPSSCPRAAPARWKAFLSDLPAVRAFLPERYLLRSVA